LAGYEGVVSLFEVEFPAAATNRIPASAAAEIAPAMPAENDPPPHELLLTTMLWPAAFKAIP
jgi:hypothetical protein